MSRNFDLTLWNGKRKGGTQASPYSCPTSMGASRQQTERSKKVENKKSLVLALFLSATSVSTFKSFLRKGIPFFSPVKYSCQRTVRPVSECEKETSSSKWPPDESNCKVVASFRLTRVIH